MNKKIKNEEFSVIIGISKYDFLMFNLTIVAKK